MTKTSPELEEHWKEVIKRNEEGMRRTRKAFNTWFTRRQKRKRLDAFMADTYSLAALVTGGIFIGIFIGIFLVVLAMGG